MAIVTIDDWKDGEFQYCEDLVRNGGCKEVPYGSVLSYLELQRAGAKYDKRPDVMAAFSELIHEWRSKTEE
ncbi:MAG: hypothetical protein L0Z53_22470 [Acidobacteriales bacterium]|nr:hypothetical protein [Terriglobales bacterium]